MAFSSAIERWQSRLREDRLPPRWILLSLLPAVVVLRGRMLPALVGSLGLDPDGYRRLADNLLHRGEFAWEVNRQVLPTAFRPPLYPLLIVPLEAAPFDLIGLFHVLLGLVTVWGTWRLARAWGVAWPAALVAAGLVAADPILINQAAHVMNETLATCLAVLTLLALTRLSRVGSMRMATLVGVLMGLCILCRPTFIVWLALVVLAFPWFSGLIGRRAWLATVALTISAAATLTPWAVRNWIVFGAPVVTTTHGGFTLLLANNRDFYDYLRNAPWGSTWDATDFNADWSSLADQNVIPGSFSGAIDEVGNEREAYRRALAAIRDQPSMFAYACLVRVGWLWSVLPHATSDDESPSRRGLRYAVAIGYTLELLLAIAGAWAVGRRWLRSPRLWGLLLVASFTLVHTFFWTNMRMRAPLVPLVCLAAAEGAWLLAERLAGATLSRDTV